MYFLYLFIFLLGLCVGSFLNVLILRLPKGKKAKGRSYCPKCKKKLRWHELIPLFSFIFLCGKCSRCKKPISFQYPLVEFLTGLFFVLNSWQIIKTSGVLNFETIIEILFWFFFLGVLIVIFSTDFKFFIVPDRVIYPAILVAFSYQVFKFFSLNNWKPSFTFGALRPVFTSVFAGAISALFFFSLILLTKGKGMGLGDVKIAAFMGILLSFPNIFVALFLAFFSGSVIGLILIILKRKKLKSEVPFGCFLAPATFIAFFWGTNLITFYYNLFLW
ncbi:MAG: prepilin peptidase [Candidatus Pacebacteria bacterium]|nr:prepilin peptidase [Candidatus Paceibacterota bacterium]